MKIKRHLVAKTGVLLLLGLSVACGLDEIDDDVKLPNVTAPFGIIVGTSSITVQEIVSGFDSEVAITEDNNGLLIATEEGESSSYSTITDIVSIFDVNNADVIAPGISAIAVGTTLSESFSETLVFEHPISDESQLDSLIYSQGQISLNVTSTFDVPMDYVFTLNDIKDRSNEQPIVFTGTVPAGGSDGANISLINHRLEANWEPANLNDAELTNDTDRNVFTGDFTATLQLQDGDQVFPSQNITYAIDITGTEYQTIYGYFGRKTVDIADQTIDVSFFDEISDNGIRFESPELRIFTNSSFGVPFGLDLSQVQSVNNAGNTLALSGSITQVLQQVRKVDIDNVGDTVQSVTRINADNSNIADILNTSPVQVNLNFRAESNFGVTDSSTFNNRNFVDQTSAIEVRTEIEMPFSVQMNNFTRDVEFDLFNTDIRDADTVYVRLRTINNMPVTGTVQLLILGAEEQTIHEEGAIQAIISPTFNTAGRIESVGDTLVQIALFDQGLTAFETAEKMRFAITVNSSGIEEDRFVRLFSDYGLEFKISLAAAINSDLGL